MRCNNFLLLATVGTLLFGCSGSDDQDVQTQEPLQLELEIELIGSSSTSPNGDGSGTIQCSATSNKEAVFSYKINNNEVYDTEDGRLNYSFTTIGTQNHTIEVTAIDQEGKTAKVSKQIEVLFVQQEGLLWSDEFSAEGPPDISKWSYETQPPNNGSWWNEEVQHYTSRPINSFASNGIFNIVAFKEPYNAFGSTKGFTSARLKTQDKFSFRYGRVEIRAKLPSSAGTWPAVWMLGANVDVVGWPSCGEIDIIEQFSDKTQNISTAHWRGENGQAADYGQSISLPNLTTSFNLYEFSWTPTSVSASLNGEEYFVMNLNNSMPFDNEFFLIMNLALGGDKGAGPVDFNFDQDQLEIDYIRIYEN